jgi:hypothetical protein
MPHITFNPCWRDEGYAWVKIASKTRYYVQHQYARDGLADNEVVIELYTVNRQPYEHWHVRFFNRRVGSLRDRPTSALRKLTLQKFEAYCQGYLATGLRQIERPFDRYALLIRHGLRGLGNLLQEMKQVEDGAWREDMGLLSSLHDKLQNHDLRDLAMAQKTIESLTSRLEDVLKGHGRFSVFNDQEYSMEFSELYREWNVFDEEAEDREHLRRTAGPDQSLPDKPILQN